MNPLLFIALCAAVVGLGIEIYEKQKEKQAAPEGDDPPVEKPAVEVKPNATKASDGGSSGNHNGSDSGVADPPVVVEPAEQPSINLDNQ